MNVFDSVVFSGSCCRERIDAFLDILQQGSVPAKSDYIELKFIWWLFDDRGSSSRSKGVQAMYPCGKYSISSCSGIY